MDDAIDWAIEHRDLLKRILAHSSGAIGEILVANELSRRGWDVVPLNNNSRQRDLVVRRDGISYNIEVKCNRSRTTFWVTSEPNAERNDFWIFVVAPREPAGLPKAEDVEYYVFSTAEAIALWRASLKKSDGTQSPDIKYPRLVRSDGLNAWHKLDRSAA